MRLSTLLLGFLPLGAWASSVLELDDDSFDQYVGKGKPPALVELYVFLPHFGFFYAFWC
jgi:hypothetical protein